jgi:hypothetical protein
MTMLDMTPILRGSRGEIIMRLHSTAAALLVVACLGVATQAPAASQSRLGALAARQDLHDMICYAMADGSISHAERVMILMQAKGVLTADEYVAFKKTIDRLSPQKSTAGQLAKTTRKKPAASRKPSPTPESAPGPVMPAGATQPDQVAPPKFFR